MDAAGLRGDGWIHGEAIAAGALHSFMSSAVAANENKKKPRAFGKWAFPRHEYSALTPQSKG